MYTSHILTGALQFTGKLGDLCSPSFYMKVLDFIAKLLLAVSYHQHAQKTWSPKKETKSKQNKYFLNAALSSWISWLLCKVFKVPSFQKPQKMRRRWGHLSPSPPSRGSLRIGHPQRKRWWQTYAESLNYRQLKLCFLHSGFLPWLCSTRPSPLNLTSHWSLS